MPRIDFGNNRGENLSDPIYDKDAVNNRTLKRKVTTIEGSFLSTISGGTVNGAISATTISACTGIYTSNLYGCSPLTIHDNTSVDGDLIVSGVTTTVGSRVKKVREFTVIDSGWSSGEPQQIIASDEIVLVTDGTTGGAPGPDEFNIDLSNIINYSPVGRVVEIIKVGSGPGGLVIGAFAIGGSYTINGVTGTPTPSICSSTYQSITIVKRASLEVVYYGTGL